MELMLPNGLLYDISSKKCGCYVVQYYEIEMKSRRVLVPLRTIDYELEIVNSLLNINLTQKYENPTDKFLNVNYSLPINADTSIYKFYVFYGDTKIEGVVKEKEQAKKEFEEAKKEGRQAAMGNYDPESKDIINFEIGNIPPKTEFQVKVSMLQEMSVSMSTFYKLIVPGSISPRYMNKVDGKANVPEHMKQKGVSSGKADFTWNFKVSLKTTRKVIFFDSPSHQIKLLKQNDQGTESEFVMEKSEIPNKDFTFVYTTEDFQLPSYTLGKADISSTVMLSFIPKFCYIDVDDAYKAYIAKKYIYADVSNSRGEYIFLLDRSGSMGGKRIYKAKYALILFLKSLPYNSYFNIVSFGSDFRKMFDDSQQYTSETMKETIENIKSMNANMGGTYIYDPLLEILKYKVIEGYPKHIFLLTDGCVSNVSQIVKTVEYNTKYSRVHTIGVGDGISLYLIQQCAKAGKGKSVVIADNENTSYKIIELLEATLSPLISKINLTYKEDSAIESIFPNPKKIPYILKDDVVNFYVTFKGPLTEKKYFTFEYYDDVNKLPFKSTIVVDPNDLANQPFVDRMAHFKVLRALEKCANNGVEIQDEVYYVKVKDFKKEAIDYSVKHQVLSEFTSFLCVGKKLVDGQYQYFNDKGVFEVQVEQPQMKNVYLPMAGSYRSRIGLDQASYIKAPVSYLFYSAYSKKYKSSKFGDVLPAIGSFFYGAKNKVSSLFSSSFSAYGSSQYSMSKSTSHKKKRTTAKASQAKCELSSKREQFVYKYYAFDYYDVSVEQNLEQIVNSQNVNGSWDDAELLKNICKDWAQVSKLFEKWGQQLVVTHLIARWIQRYHNEKQYSLILKKALAWIKKQNTNVDEKDLESIQFV